MSDSWPGPLQGVRVIDFTHVLAGPFATQILADLGAEVIKVESPQGGDLTRSFPPFKDGESHYFLGMNHNKKSVVIDLQDAEGVAIAVDLIANADVVVENFRPDVMQRFGLDYNSLSAINPSLVYCSITGFGLSGPLKDKPSFDIVTQALSGAMSSNGELDGQATKIGLPIGDLVGGVFGPVAIVSALYERAQTGKGRLIDVSLLDGLQGMLGYLPQLAWFEQENPKPMGSSHLNIVPYGDFPCMNGRIVIACLSDAFWAKLCHCLGLETLSQDDRLASLAGRKQHREEVNAAISSVTSQLSLETLQQRLNENDVPNAPVLGVLEALKQQQSQARDMVALVQHTKLGEIPVVGRPIKFPGSPQADLQAPPVMGEHTVEVLTDLLGLDDEQVQKLKDSGIVV